MFPFAKIHYRLLGAAGAAVPRKQRGPRGQREQRGPRVAALPFNEMNNPLTKISIDCNGQWNNDGDSDAC